MVWIPLIAAGIGAAGAISSSIIANQKPKQPKVKETDLERDRRHLLRDVIKSVKTGKGKYGDLFNFDEEAFQKSYVDPAISRYNNEIAPAINNQYAGNVNSRTSGHKDALTRAGVDMNTLLNEQYANQKNAVEQRKLDAIAFASGANTGSPTTSGGGYSNSQAGKIGAANYFQSESFGKSIENILEEYNKKKPADQANTNPYQPDQRKGYEPINA